MVKDVVIVGGGTAGWLTAAYLGKRLAAGSAGGIRITLIESADIGILGVGEGTFPSIIRTLERIGLSEAKFLKESNATFKQGIRFDNWQYGPGHKGRNHYFHPFASFQERTGLDLIPYWLLNCAGDGVALDDAVTIQKKVADAHRGPKRITDKEYEAPLTYAYHFDAVRFAKVLREAGIELGVHHIIDTVDAVNLDESGAIQSLTTREHGSLKGDFFIDCTGFRAQLIGQALKVPYKSCRSTLFCDRAVAMQVPYDRPDAPIASYTISTAHEAGWTWDIGLDERRGTGYVYSSAHTDDSRAEQVLRDYVGPAAEGKSVRSFKYEAGYRETPWSKNCVAIGLSSGFFEPLEATGIVLVEVAAILLANLFPWAGDLQTGARQFNNVMRERYEGCVDFLKLHYCLSERVDTDFWRDNADAGTVPDSLKDLLDRWRFRPPDAIDFNMNTATFHHSSWQFVAYGMGFKTDLSAKAGAYRFYDEARKEFATIRRQADIAVTALPSHRDLVTQIYRHGFMPGRA
jgi:tryptophan halogenase